MDEAVGDLKQALPCVAEAPTVHVEVHQRSGSTAKKEDVKLNVRKLLNRHNIVFGDYTWTEFDEPFLTRNVQSVSIVDTELKVKDPQPIDLSTCTVALHVFQLNEGGPSSENLEEETENIIAANHWLLPAAEFHGLWDSLVYDAEVKSHLLDYVMTTLLFSDKNVDSNLITWNRVVLLHGPPGTGKTSLCKALAQKLTIRLSSRYRYGQLIEINSHSLFSKWFSESGKLVTRMFQKIQDLIDDKDALVFVLIDEVESLTAARNACRAGTEPSDAIRVVNAVLTQIDQIKRHSNVVILTTSNITERIDVAFVDRADIRQYVGPPSAAAIFKIYLSCLEELMKGLCLQSQCPPLSPQSVTTVQGACSLVADLERRPGRKCSEGSQVPACLLMCDNFFPPPELSPRPETLLPPLSPDVTPTKPSFPFRDSASVGGAPSVSLALSLAANRCPHHLTGRRLAVFRRAARVNLTEPGNVSLAACRVPAWKCFLPPAQPLTPVSVGWPVGTGNPRPPDLAAVPGHCVHQPPSPPPERRS